MITERVLFFILIVKICRLSWVYSLILLGSPVEKEKRKLEKLQAELESLVYEHSNLVDRITTVASELMFYSYWKYLNYLHSCIIELSRLFKMENSH